MSLGIGFKMIKVSAIILSLQAIQVLSEEQVSCISQKDCLENVDTIGDIARTRVNEKVKEADDAELKFTLDFIENVARFNELVTNNTSDCHDHLISGNDAVVEALEKSFSPCKELIEGFEDADDEIEREVEDMLKESPIKKKKKEWTRAYCKLYPQYANYYCDYSDNRKDVFKNQCKISQEFNKLYFNPWSDCVSKSGSRNI